jgi:phage terminase large subunit-like protein
MLELDTAPVDTPVDTAEAYGHALPRLFTPPLGPLTPETSEGFKVIAWAEEKLGFKPMPWQREVLIRALELLPDGSYRFSTILILVARQSGKSTVLNILSAYWLAHGIPLQLGVSSTLDLAREVWEQVVEIADDNAHVFGPIKVRRANDGISLTIIGKKSRYKIAAMTGSAARRVGRGLTVHRLIVDEARALEDWEAWGAASNATVAVPTAQTFLLSNAGSNKSVVLNTLRALAISGTDPSLCLLEWSAPDGCELSDVNAILAANPAIGHGTVTLSSVLSQIRKQPASVSRTENLCQSVPADDAAVDSQSWSQCLDAGTLDDHRKRVTLAFEASDDLRHMSLVAAAVMPNGRVRVETVATWTSTAVMRRELEATVKKVAPRAFGWYTSGPSAAFSTLFTKIPRNKPLSQTTAAGACQLLSEHIKAGLLSQSGDELLAAHILSARWRKQGENRVFARTDGGHCDAAFAMAGAVHLARQLPKPMKLSVVTAGGARA